MLHSQGLSSNSASPQSTGPDALLEETLGRLSKKPGVKATIVLDRTSGAILKTSGQVSAIRKTNPTNPSLPAQTAGAFSGDVPTAGAASFTQEQGVQELAAIVWNFIGTAGGLVQQLDTEVTTTTSTQPKSVGFQEWLGTDVRAG